jgi:hypothetical protein
MPCISIERANTLLREYPSVGLDFRIAKSSTLVPSAWVVAGHVDRGIVLLSLLAALWLTGTAAVGDTLEFFLAAKARAKNGVLALEGRNDAVGVVCAALRSVVHQQDEDAAAAGRHDAVMWRMVFDSPRWCSLVVRRG